VAAPRATVDPVAQIEAAAERITHTHLVRSELQFRQAFLALRIREHEGLQNGIEQTRRKLLDQSRQLQAQLREIFWPRRVASAQEALRAHAREHGGEATARLLAGSPQRFGPLRGAPLTPMRQRARETARQAGARLSALHATRHRLGELSRLAASKEHLAALHTELVGVSAKLRKLPSIPVLHHHLLRSIERGGGLAGVASRLSPPTLALAEKALALGRSWMKGLSR